MSHQHIARKRFGQHFLHDLAVLNAISRAINPQPNDSLVEIGPGLGALTKAVLPFADHLHLIEIDRDLCQKILETYPKDKVTLHQADALQFDFRAIYLSENKPLRVFGNLPYNISTPLLFHLLQYSDCIQDLIFMLQKEVVDRMVAQPNTADYGRLSVMIQYACQAESLFDVPPSAFSPPPKVMSSVVRLVPYQNNAPHLPAKNYSAFALIVKTAFQYRRKTLRNALHSIIGSDEIYAKANIDPKRRPETLSVSEFISLSNYCLFS